MSQTKTTIHRLLGVSVGLSLLFATSAAGDNSTPVDEEAPLLVEGTWAASTISS